MKQKLLKTSLFSILILSIVGLFSYDTKKLSALILFCLFIAMPFVFDKDNNKIIKELSTISGMKRLVKEQIDYASSKDGISMIIIMVIAFFVIAGIVSIFPNLIR